MVLLRKSLTHTRVPNMSEFKVGDRVTCKYTERTGTIIKLSALSSTIIKINWDKDDEDWEYGRNLENRSYLQQQEAKKLLGLKE